MNKIIKSLLLLTFLFSANLFALDSTKIEQNIKELKLVKENGLLIKKIIDLENIWGVRTLNPQSNMYMNLFVSKDLKFTFIGEGFFNETLEKIGFAININELKGKEALTYGNGKEVIYLFTDPSCPACARFDKTIDKYKDLYTFKIYFFLLESHFPNSRQKAYYILDGKNNKEKFKRLYNTTLNIDNNWAITTIPYSKTIKYDKILNEHIEYANGLNLKGTPSLLNEKGQEL